MHQINIQDLDYSYVKGEFTLQGVNLNISNPQLISIIGPNGVGKSTLIHCMNRILEPTGGVIYIDNRNVEEYPIKELARKMGYVPYTSSDSFPMTVVDTILMGRNPHKKWKSLKDDLKVVREVMDLMDITPLAMRPFNELSAGQHQRVMLARGLAQEPEIILLDEPTANLDIKHQMDVIRLLKELSVKKNLVVIMISHDLNLAAKYSDNVIILFNKGIYDIGHPSKVITAENIQNVYGVECEITQCGGRPFVIMKDSSFHASETSENCIADCKKNE